MNYPLRPLRLKFASFARLIQVFTQRPQSFSQSSPRDLIFQNCSLRPLRLKFASFAKLILFFTQRLQSFSQSSQRVVNLSFASFASSICDLSEINSVFSRRDRKVFLQSSQRVLKFSFANFASSICVLCEINSGFHAETAKFFAEFARYKASIIILYPAFALLIEFLRLSI